jgi:hypothetical protein
VAARHRSTEPPAVAHPRARRRIVLARGEHEVLDAPEHRRGVVAERQAQQARDEDSLDDQS